MTRILITGAAGFIGSHLAHRLGRTGCELVLVDNLSSGSLNNLSGLQEAATIITGDFEDLADHKTVNLGFDYIYHLASLISGQESLSKPELYIDTNIRKTAVLLRLAEHWQPKKIIFASSSSVYGSSAPNVNELARPAPTTVYAISKLACEHLLKSWTQHTGVSHTSIRLFNVYGPRQSPKHSYANVVCHFAYAAAHGLDLHRYGTGTQTRDFVYIDDVIDALVQVQGETEHDVYNIGSGQESAINDLIALARERSSHHLTVIEKPPWKNDIQRISADVARYSLEFAPPKPVALNDGFSRTVEYFLSVPREG